MIPRIIHQTWYSRTKMPREYHRILHDNQEMNPGYRFLLWDDNDLDRFFRSDPRIPGTLRSVFFRINPHYGSARADIFRYVIIYLEGGIYLDIKIRCKTPLDEWIAHESERALLYSYWDGFHYQKEELGNANGEIQNWFLVAPPLHPTLGRVLDHLELISTKVLFSVIGKHGVLRTTGPLMYTKILESAGDTEYLCRIRSDKYLDYGTSFSGLCGGRYRHYSLLDEPIFMNFPTFSETENIQIFSLMPRTRFTTFKSLSPGLHIFATQYRLLTHLDTIFPFCNCVYAYDPITFVLKFVYIDQTIPIEEYLPLYDHGGEIIHYIDGFCFCQMSFHEGLASFHFKDYLFLS